METTTENNRLIAEFLGLQLEQDQERLFVNGLGTKLINETFNTDWNWLMEVVERINDLNNVVEIHENHVRVVSNTRSEALVDVVSGSMLEAVYNACVEFIKLQNEQ